MTEELRRGNDQRKPRRVDENERKKETLTKRRRGENVNKGGEILMVTGIHK